MIKGYTLIPETNLEKFLLDDFQSFKETISSNYTDLKQELD